MKLLCITDPTTHPDFDTTVELYNRFAEDETIEFFHLPVSHVSSSASIKVASVTQALSYQEFLKLDSVSNHEATYQDFDLVFSRADKPHPENFHKNLAQFENQVRFVNRPSGMINSDHHGFLSDVAGDLIPKHIFSRNKEEIESFFEENKQKIVAKQNTGYGGKWIYKIFTEDGNYFIDNIADGLKTFSTFDQLITSLLESDSDPFLFVEFLENVHLGDKRVIVVEDQIYGAYLRTSKDGGWINNITSGATASPSEISEKEIEVIKYTAKEYNRNGLITLGYDFLADNNGEWILSEVNAGNIGGYGRLEEISGEKIYQRLIDHLKKLSL